VTPAATDPLPELTDLIRLRAEAQACFAEYLTDLRDLVDLDCGTYLPDGVNRVADRMQERFAAWGWSVQRRSHHPAEGEPPLGDLLVATIQAGAHAPHVLLIGHMDTVFPEGTAARRPYRTEGDRAFGPGVSDMKGGLLAGLYAVRCLQGAGMDAGLRVTYVCNPDEEIGSPWSGPQILEVARHADVCFVLEGARENGDIVSARKGVADLRIAFTGRAAHAGVEPERGRSATLQAAHTTVALHQLNGRWPGTTVNVGVISGGTRPNVVAERCELEVDVRSSTARGFDQALAAAEETARQTVVPDVIVEVRRQAGFPPMEKTPATTALVERAVATAGRLGFELNDAATGGASDANPVAGMGVPTLDGLGPVGGADHSPGEWLDLGSVVPRMALLASLIHDPLSPPDS
jgi:glutamate carboxypeptidase